MAKQYKMGDKLPGSLLTEEEWVQLRDEVDQAENPMELWFRKKILDECRELATIHCVGEKAHKCLLCGNEQDHASGLCRTCLNAINNRCALRQCGRVHGLSNSDVVCLSCGQRKAKTLGLCRNCYHRMKRLGLKSAAELLQYESKDKQESGPAVPEWNPIFKES